MKTKTTRKVLIILSNRWNRAAKARHLEIQCDEQGTVLSEKPLRAAPTTPGYDEVWENDEGRSKFADCHRFSRKYGHKLQKKP